MYVVIALHLILSLVLLVWEHFFLKVALVFFFVLLLVHFFVVFADELAFKIVTFSEFIQLKSLSVLLTDIID